MISSRDVMIKQLKMCRGKRKVWTHWHRREIACSVQLGYSEIETLNSPQIKVKKWLKLASSVCVAKTHFTEKQTSQSCINKYSYYHEWYLFACGKEFRELSANSVSLQSFEACSLFFSARSSVLQQAAVFTFTLTIPACSTTKTRNKVRSCCS